MGKLLACLSICLLLIHGSSAAEDGYRLWLRYDRVKDQRLSEQYRQRLSTFWFYDKTKVSAAARKEWLAGLRGLLATEVQENETSARVLIFTKNTKPASLKTGAIDYNRLGPEGFFIKTMNTPNGVHTIITANEDAGILYAVFHFLRLLQTQQDIRSLEVASIPKIQRRLLNHWDNLNRTVERGYAGLSIWNWHTLPAFIDQRYIDYARANASVGINGTVLTNVNANAQILTHQYLEKVKALADVFRPYHIKVYLTARFSAPMEIGGLTTADPAEEKVQRWWKDKAKEIYQLIPDFGGFLVKANSEGQPGPQNYGRSHAEGANMLADAIAPFGGIVMWRAFVYSNPEENDRKLNQHDRFKEAFNEFKPLDGLFRENVLLQVKNGPIDFQPREPFSPLFGSMAQMPLMIEFQITQEYLGQGTHLVYEAPLFKEVMEAKTYRPRKGATVATIVDGSATSEMLTGIAGVSNIGNERNWTFHPFGQANWYALGRLAWNHELSSATLAEEWIRQTFGNEKKLIQTISSIMLASRENAVNYMAPLGLHHIMGTGHHYGPAPWVNDAGRPDWNPVYFHRADSSGIGFDRTETGSNALAQYAPEVQQYFENPSTCPEQYLLWFHHLPWNYKMKSGNTLWNELCLHYQSGVDGVKRMQQQWREVVELVDTERLEQVNMLLQIQLNEAKWWRDACLSYFQQFSKMPLPPGVEQPQHNQEYYKQLKFPFAPGIGGNN